MGSQEVAVPATVPPALEISGVTKTYPGVSALRGVSLAVAPGTIRGLVGENGAGKSTLIKVASGAVGPDAGTVEVGGVAVTGDVRRAAAAGVATIYQELTVVPAMTSLDNVFLGHLPRRWLGVDRAAARRRFRRVCEQVQVDIDPRQRAAGLSTSAQQLLEVMRALVLDRQLLIMDEPTASLGPADVARLHHVIRGLRGQGMSIVYVSHDLDAVLDVCDEVTVMREGRVVATRPSGEWSTTSLVAAMLGGVALADAGARRPGPAPGTPLLSIRDLQAPGVDVPALDLRAGEVVGLAGLVGSGRTRLLRAVAGADPVAAGSLQVDGAPRPWPRSPRQGRRLGILLSPEDRRAQGLVLHRSAAWNTALGRFGDVTRAGLTERAFRAWARPHTTDVGLGPGRLATAVGNLSGGNQQKVLLARQLAQRSRCLLLDEPTRGIDVGAKAQVFETVRRLVAGGRTVIWCSSDLAEVVEHSDRVLVVAAGRVVTELPGGCSVDEVLQRAFGATGGTSPDDGAGVTATAGAA